MHVAATVMLLILNRIIEHDKTNYTQSRSPNWYKGND